MSRIVNGNRGIVGAWPLDEGGGTIAYDRSGYGNNGTLVNAPVPVISKYGPALSFNGTNQYVHKASSVVNAYPYTLSAWVNLSNSSGGAVISITNVSDWYGIFISASSTGVTLTNTYGGGTDIALGITTTLNNGTWYFITAVCTSENDISIYLNGGSKATSTVNNHFGNTNVTDIGIIGGIWDAHGYSNYFHGSIGDVCIYNRALSASEVMQLYINPNGIYVKRPSLLSMVAGLTPTFTAIYGAAYMSAQQSGAISTSTNIASALAAAQNGSGLISASNQLAGVQNATAAASATAASSASIAGALSVGFASVSQGSVAKNILGSGSILSGTSAGALSSVPIASASNMSVLSFGNITVSSPVGGYISGTANYSAGVVGTLTSKLSIAGLSNQSSGTSVSGSVAVNLSAIADYCISSHAALTAPLRNFYYGQIGIIELSEKYEVIDMSNKYGMRVLN